MMSDDLVKRLRGHIAVTFGDRGHVFEDEALCDDAADRIEELEAKLAKAVQLIDDIFSDGEVKNCDCELCKSHLERRAELTGGKDE